MNTEDKQQEIESILDSFKTEIYNISTSEFNADKQAIMYSIVKSAFAEQIMDIMDI